MAVANPCLQKEWDEWKREMEVKRRGKWRERLSHWAKEKVNEEEEEDEEMEDEIDGNKEFDEEEGDEETEAGWKGEEKEEMQEESEQEQEGEGQSVKREKEDNKDKEKEAKVNEEVDSKGQREMEVQEMEEANEVAEVKREEVEENRVKEEEEEGEWEDLEENQMEREVNVNEKVKEEDEMEVGQQVEGKEKVGNEFAGEIKEKEEVEDEEGKDGAQGELVGFGNWGDVQEDEETVGRERGMMGARQWMAEGELEEEIEVEAIEDEEDREAKEEEHLEEGDDRKEEQPEQEQGGHFGLRMQFGKHVNERKEENVEQNQESAPQEHETIEEDNVLDSDESKKDDSETECEDKSFNSERLKNEDEHYRNPSELKGRNEMSGTTENSSLGVWTSEERQKEENETEKIPHEEETVGESWKTLVEDQGKLQEEDSTDDEDSEYSMYEDEDGNEHVVKLYCKDDYPTKIFHTLKEFRDSSLLTDLNLSTEDGKSFFVHSPVLAAVSSHIWEILSRGTVENSKDGEREDDGKVVGVNTWSLPLGSEVDHVGLEAVVEFAYSGFISRLNKDTVEQIKAAAQTLGASRVLDLCTEEGTTKTGEQKREERISAAEELTITLQSIKQQWIDRVGCDVVLEAIGETLHVHRVILAASSDYFRGMFTLGMRESHQTCVTLPFLLASELEALISCSYSGTLALSWRCVFEITSTALQLQYQPVLSLCLNFLQQEMNPHSCLDVASFAEAYEMAQLLEVADDFILRQFQKVACTLKFKDLPAKHLLKYLNSHSLCVPSELVVFKAVVAWILAKPQIRLKLAKELMETVHFRLMTFKEFKEVQSLKMWTDHSLVELYKAVSEDFCSSKTAPQSQCRIYLPKESLVLIGGDQISEGLETRRISKELWFGNSLRNHTGIKKAMEWRKLGEMPESARFGHEVALLNGKLYILGGKKYYGIGDTLNSVYSYDPHQNSWESLADMQEKRYSFSVVVLDGKIYAIGGHCDPEYIDSVERYCPTANSWSFTCPMNLPQRGHVAKVLRGQIFVSGGLNSDHRCLSSMFLYHPETGSTSLANMTKPRALHCMETLGGCLYVAGGITTDGNNIVVDQLACEVYNPAADSWTAFTGLKVPHVGAGSVVMEGKFYVLGGYSQEDYSDTKMVHRYDPTTQRWENMGKMPGPNNDIRAALLSLPPHFRS